MDLAVFRILVMDLSAGKGRIEELEGRDEWVGGSGLAALLYDRYGLPEEPWNHPDQPFILAVGPLTGLFPLMSKTVSAFKSPYHDQYTESHAGGRSALAIRHAGFDAIVIRGKAREPSVLVVGPNQMRLEPAPFLAGLDVLRTGKLVRSMIPASSGHRSIMRIGPAGEKGCAFACINADTYRHFGRMGGGTVWGDKNLKALVVLAGDGPLHRAGDRYRKLHGTIHEMVTTKQMLKKYHDLGTPANLEKLNRLESLPWRNLQETWSPDVTKISGVRFAEETLLRNLACSGCPVGCIHLGYVRERFRQDHRYFFRQVVYDYEPIYSVGTMLGVTEPAGALRIMDEIEKAGLDVMSAGVALAWATEALERGVVGREDVLEPLAFGDWEPYMSAVWHLARGTNSFYRLLAQGTMEAARHYGGEDFACVLGQEMAGYATGEVFFAAQSSSFRHSHLDCGGYAWDQEHDEKEIGPALDFLIADERRRTMLNCLVVCLFARSVYSDEVVADCLQSVGLDGVAADLPQISERVVAKRWRIRFATGYDPESIRIPKRFLKVKTWKGPIDPEFLAAFRRAYIHRIRQLYLD